MGSPLSRITVIKNNTQFLVEIHECSRLGITHDPVYVKPHKQQYITATKYNLHCGDTSNCRSIKIYCKKDLIATLTPLDFIINCKLIIQMNDQNHPYLKKVKDTQFFLLRIR
jgi:hypothetical protein